MSAAVTGLTGVTAQPLERVPMCTRQSTVTRAGWRLALSSEQGSGAILLVELAPDESYYRGEGVCLGWPQARLAEAYEALTRAGTAGAPDFELPQLG